MSMESQNGEKQDTDIVYKIKVVQFFGRSVPIVLQNDNGPCPLLAICNVLLLRNNITISHNSTEAASSRLLQLVAERLLDANSNIENKDEEYVRNQQQNISDAISLLHRLATGLDVNLRFRNIHDFEFTPECAVFDLLDIGLVHGWLFDPQDEAASKVIGANSYNTLVEKLVELQTRKVQFQGTSPGSAGYTLPAAMTFEAPSLIEGGLLETHLFEVLEEPGHYVNKKRKGDAEEAVQLLQALKVSEEILSTDVQDCKVDENQNSVHDEQTPVGIGACGIETSFAATRLKSSGSIGNDCRGDYFEGMESSAGEPLVEDLIVTDKNAKCNNNLAQCPVEEVSVALKLRSEDEQVFLDVRAAVLPVATPDEHRVEVEVHVKDSLEPPAPLEDPPQKSRGHGSYSDGETETPLVQIGLSNLTPNNHLGSTIDVPYTYSPNFLYGGNAEAHVENQDVMGFKTELENASSSEMLSDESRQVKDDDDLSIAVTEGMIIENFLKNNASQLTYYGLFCLQDVLKERELCVFFRNNHFNTMFKYNGNLFLLVTDQGYLNQPDIVWEKLDEVHGDSVFFTGSFIPFQVDQGNGPWNEQDAVAATADYLSSHGGAHHSNGSNSDLQLAMSLQHQEFEQQQQQQHQRQIQSTPLVPSHPQSHASGMATRPDGSRLVVGPKRSQLSSKPDLKSKCTLM